MKKDGSSSHGVGSLIKTANRNLVESFARIPVAWLLAKLSIKHRYQRSLLGPFWITISQAIYILTLGLVFGAVFQQRDSNFVPFVACGALAMGLITTSLQSSSSCLIQKAHMIRDGDRYILAHVCELLFRNLLIFAHHAVIAVVVLLIFRIPVTPLDVILTLIGLFLIVANLLGFGFIAAIATLRYRDFDPLIASILKILFFVTPIMWKPEFLGSRERYVNWNPIHHWINLVRAPLLGDPFRIDSLLVTLATGFLSLILAYIAFVIAHRKIAVWL